MSEQDTEFTLTTGKILVIFLALAVVCGIFFGLGYSLGRKSTPLSTNLGTQGQPQTSGTKSGKPEPGVTVTPQPTCVGQDCGGSLAQSIATPSPYALNGGSSATAASDNGTNGTPSVITSQQKGYIVQVAAVTRQEDADVLVNALRKKNYPVFIANLPTDKLLHVQVGPFTDRNEAEAMRSRLSADGYNAILK